VNELGLGLHLAVVGVAVHVPQMSAVHSLQRDGGIEDPQPALFFLSVNGESREAGEGGRR
jgi:hypothetical protein